MLCPRGGDPRLGERVAPRLPRPTCLMPFPVVVSYAPQAASPRGYRGLCRALRVCPGGICFGRPAHACVDREQWLRAHIIYLFTHLYSSPLGRAHAAEVLGGSAATTVYWSEGERARSNFLSDPSIADYRFAHTISRTTCITLVCLREERRTPAVCSRFVWPAHPRLVVVVCCVLTGGGMHFLGYLLWQARACMCGP